MSDARECNACGELARLLDTIHLTVEAPFEKKSATGLAGDVLFRTWEVDIDAACLDRPLRDVLVAACIGFGLPASEVKAPVEEKAGRGGAEMTNVETDRFEAGYRAGRRSLAESLLSQLSRALDPRQQDAIAVLSELESARTALRDLVDEPDWPAGLHLQDVIEKYIRPLIPEE
jgi:hypothetical protein